MHMRRAPRASRSFAQGIIYDGVVLSDFFDITELKRQPFPQVSANTLTIPGRAGVRFASSQRGTRTLSMKLSLLSHGRDDFSVAARWDEMVDLLIKEEPKALELGDGKTIYALPTNASELERLGNRGVSTVTFTAYDPYFYGPSHDVALSSGNNIVIIKGTQAVRPTVSITGTTGAITARNVETTERVVTASVSSSSARVVMDMETQRCTVNGSYLAVDMDHTDYWELIPGTNTVYLSGGTGTLTYTEKYL